MKQLLITGFDPFGGESVNPAWEAVKSLPDEIGTWTLTKLQIPTVFGEAANTVLKTVDAMPTAPDVILCIGQAGGRAAVTPEFVAINYRHASIADNAGTLISESPILDGAPAAFFATVPVQRMTEAIAASGIVHRPRIPRVRLSATMCCIPFCTGLPIPIQRSDSFTFRSCPSRQKAKPHRPCRFVTSCAH